MASTSSIADPAAAPPAEHKGTSLLVSVDSQDRESLNRLLLNLEEAFAGENIVVATPDGPHEMQTSGSLRVTGYTPPVPLSGSWTLTAADFLNDYTLLQQHQAAAVLHLGQGAESLAPGALRNLATAVREQQADLALPCYDLPARAGLVNSAILYPLTRALFATNTRFPLALDLCLSARAAERLAMAAQRLTASNQPEALLWPVTEASVAGFAITEVPAGTRLLPSPANMDLNAVLAMVAGSLFNEIDLRASFWQRSRMAQPPLNASSATPAGQGNDEEIQSLLNSFRLAYTNLHEVWSLVLPPQSLVGLKRLSGMPTESFSMPDALWARIVYDFLLAYRLRTINRGHLLGALTPLYLAWVASHILLTRAGQDPERHVQAVAAAFENDKPYLVSRWRWPDRFNP